MVEISSEIFRSRAPEDGDVLSGIELKKVYWIFKGMQEEFKRSQDFWESTNSTLQHVSVELSKAQAKLKEQEKFSSIGIFATGMAHEFGNKIAALSSGLIAIENNINNELKIAAALSVMVKTVDALTVLSKRINGASKNSLEVRPVNIKESIETSLLIVRGNTLERVKVSVDCPDVLTVNFVDSVIIQSLSNLILNSIQAMKNEGSIEIKVQELDETFFIQVIDFGHGVQDESKIFKPFETTKSEGSGIGLFFMRERLREFGSDVVLKSLSNPTIFELQLRNIK